MSDSPNMVAGAEDTTNDSKGDLLDLGDRGNETDPTGDPATTEADHYRIVPPVEPDKTQGPQKLHEGMNREY
jgi:hypothetical protein